MIEIEFCYFMAQLTKFTKSPHHHPTTPIGSLSKLNSFLITFESMNVFFKYKNESFEIPSLVQWTQSKDFVLDPPGLDDQGQFMITFHPLYNFF